jgi:large subunit ribosomal protein L1
MKRGKKYQAILKKLNKDKEYSLKEAIKFIKENKIANFDESIEMHIVTNIDAKKTDQHIRGTVTLPHGTGKTK